MTSRSKPKSVTKPDNPEQYRRFVGTAREVEVDESSDAMDRAFERVFKPKKAKDQSASKKRD
jgi:hypothetical protein